MSLLQRHQHTLLIILLIALALFIVFQYWKLL